MPLAERCAVMLIEIRYILVHFDGFLVNQAMPVDDHRRTPRIPISKCLAKQFSNDPDSVHRVVAGTEKWERDQGLGAYKGLVRAGPSIHVPEDTAAATERTRARASVLRPRPRRPVFMSSSRGRRGEEARSQSGARPRSAHGSIARKS
ncbi:hypothetical protein VUR80DRAFT_7695 [Thermomyces stellatus]